MEISSQDTLITTGIPLDQALTRWSYLGKQLYNSVIYQARRKINLGCVITKESFLNSTVLRQGRSFIVNFRDLSIQRRNSIDSSSINPVEQYNELLLKVISENQLSQQAPYHNQSTYYNFLKYTSLFDGQGPYQEFIQAQSQLGNCFMKKYQENLDGDFDSFELESMLNLSHQGIQSCYGHTQTKRDSYLILQEVQSTLHTYILQENRQVDQRIRIIKDFLGGLMMVHLKKIIHGNLNPYTIFIKPNRRACIGNFQKAYKKDNSRSNYNIDNNAAALLIYFIMTGEETQEESFLQRLPHQQAEWASELLNSNKKTFDFIRQF